MQDVGSSHVWEWRPGMSWRRVLETSSSSAITLSLAATPAGRARVAIASCLDLDPNHAGADELAELADAIAGPLPDTTPRRRHDA